MGKEYQHIVKTEITVKTIIKDGNIIQTFSPEVRIVLDELKEIDTEKIRVQHLLSDNEVKYGILSGKDLQVLNNIFFGSNVKVSCGSVVADAKRHATLNRRVDGLSRFYRDCGIVGGTKVEISIDSKNNLIDMKILK